MMNFFYLMYYKCSKLNIHLAKSYLILFKEWTCLTHSHLLKFKCGQPF
jgi:hypothetical protein